MNTTTATVACAGFAVWAAVWVALAPPPDDGPVPERRRRERLREKSVLYRMWERPVRALAAILHRRARATVDRVGRALDVFGEEDWRPEEFLAARCIPLWAGSLAIGAAVACWSGASTGLAAGVILLAATPLVVARGIRARADERVREIRSRLPHTLDLMALVLEAGSGTLFDCLEFGAEENVGNPLGDELRRAVHGIAQGAPAAAVLAEISRHLGDPDIAEVNLAIATSETQGPPLKDSLRAVAVRLRTRQVQWLEQASERAKVHITWPVMTVMIACLVIVVAPVLLAGLSAGGELIP